VFQYLRLIQLHSCSFFYKVFQYEYTCFHKIVDEPFQLIINIDSFFIYVLDDEFDCSFITITEHPNFLDSFRFLLFSKIVYDA